MAYVVAGRRDCTFCKKAQAALAAARLTYTFVDMQQPDGAALYRTSYAPCVPAYHTTVPCVFFGHCFIGGHADLVRHLDG